MRLLTTSEAAEYLFGSALKKTTLEQMRYRNTGPVFRRIGRAIRYSQADLDLYLNANAFTGTNQRAQKRRHYNPLMSDQ